MTSHVPFPPSTRTLEARPATLMTKDRRTIDTLRSARALSPRLRVEHGQPSDEPMLWIADQVVGAIGASVTGSDHRWRDQLGDTVDIVTIEL